VAVASGALVVGVPFDDALSPSPLHAIARPANRQTTGTNSFLIALNLAKSRLRDEAF